MNAKLLAGPAKETMQLAARHWSSWEEKAGFPKRINTFDIWYLKGRANK